MREVDMGISMLRCNRCCRVMRAWTTVARLLEEDPTNVARASEE